MNGKEFGIYIREYMDKKGIKYSYVAKQLGMSRQLFHSRLLGIGWTLDEVMKVTKILDLPKDVLAR